MDDATRSRTAADLIAACCELQQLADDPGCSDTLLVALHLAMDTMSDDGRMTPDRAAVDYLDEWAAWLQRNGFPFDGYTDEKPPAEVIRRLAEKWHAEEGEHVEDYIHMFEEYGWKASDD